MLAVDSKLKSFSTAAGSMDRGKRSRFLPTVRDARINKKERMLLKILLFLPVTYVILTVKTLDYLTSY